ncbi:hypothetical protein CZ797_00410 [Pseudoalteromonas sp. JB197]|nr:hypothetical protein CZ797_00410 [Pseudoalteromonas sp. JB197]
MSKCIYRRNNLPKVKKKQNLATIHYNLKQKNYQIDNKATSILHKDIINA